MQYIWYCILTKLLLQSYLISLLSLFFLETIHSVCLGTGERPSNNTERALSHGPTQLVISGI